jgi:hypothetical protein
MKKTLVFLWALAAASCAWAAKSGSCEAAAIALKSSQAVTLTAEYDSEYREYDENFGVAYYKIRLSRGSSATIWIEGGDVEDLGLDVSESVNFEDFLMASFDVEEYSSGVKAAFLESDSWDYGDGTREDPGDPTSVMFYVRIDGDVGQKTSLYYQSGIRSFTVTGEENSPKSLTFKTTEQTLSAKLVGDDARYWCKAKLVEGHKYVVRTTTPNEDIDIDFPGDLDTVQDLNYTANCVKYWLIPSETATYKFSVGGADLGTSFTMKYKTVPQRKPADHNFTDLTADNSYAVSVYAGRLNDSHDYYDQVADESLCRISLVKGQRYGFATVGATEDIRLDVYDKDGALLVYNTTVGNNSKDCFAAITATYTGYYYVGVYNPLLDVADEPSPDSQFTLCAVDCDASPYGDVFDPGDDKATASTATLLAAASGAEDSDVPATAAAAGVDSRTHVFTVSDWYDCYVIPVRNGVTYRLQAALLGEDAETSLSLGAKVFTLSGTKETAVKTTGELFPVDGEAPLTFTAGANAMYYVRVWVRDTEGNNGYGLEFPEHSMNAVAYKAGTSLGMLQVKTKGTDGTWYIGSDKKSYPNGAVVNVPANAASKVVFNDVSGFSTPSATNVQVLATGTTTALGVYNDSYDKYTTTVNKKKVQVSDNDEAYAIALSATAGKTVGAKRTLWTDDPQDNFKFTASEGVYYSFDLVDTTLDDVGDAVFSITKGGVEVVPATTRVSKRLFAPGTYILKVVHANDGARSDSSYRLDYGTFNTGKVKFSAATYKVAENSTYATLKIQRTGKEGVVRVNWATQAGTGDNAAQPGREYYPTNGIVAWKSGDKADKTVQVRLVPDLVATVESNKTFTVKLWEIDPDDIEADEFPSVLAMDEATVTLTEVTAKGAGTVSAAYYGEDDTPFANAKKPVMTAKAGKTAEITLRRSSYTALTKVAVKATVVCDKKKYKDTAVIGKDVDAFSEVVEWEDGDDDEKSISIPLNDSTDYTLTKQFTVTLAAQTTGEYKGWDKPTLAAAAITVKIANETASKSFSTFANEAKAAGMTAKSTKGSWFVDDEGALRSAEAAAASLSLTVTGPGLFAADPAVLGGCDAVLTCKIGSAAPFVCSGVAENRFARIVPSGKQTIVFSLSGGDAETYAAFNEIDGAPYKWVPFSKVAPFDPLAKSAVSTNFSSLAWTKLEELETENVFYRARIGTAAKSVATIVTNATVDSSCVLPEGSLEWGKTYYWALDYAYAGDTKEDVAAALADPSVLAWTAGPSTWSFSTVAANAEETATDGVDVFGGDFYDSITNDLPIYLVQGVYTRFEIGPSIGDSVSSRVVTGSLPPGLTLDGRAKKGVVSGTPTKAGTYTCLLQTATGTAKKPIWATTLRMTFEVIPLGASVGSFTGVLVEDGSALEVGAPRIGLLTLTATSAGKLSAKAVIAGKTFTGSKTGLDVVAEGSADSDTRAFEVEIPMSIDKKEKSKVACTGTLSVTLRDWAVDDLDAFDELVGSATLRLQVPNSGKTAVIAEADYAADLYRSDSDLAVAASVFAPFKGYYTAALAAPGVTAESGVPAGHGYLTLTVGEKGSVKVAGRLADGTSVSGSTIASPVGDLNTPENCELYVPVAFSGASYSFGGVAKIAWAEGEDGYAASILDSASMLHWYKDGASATSSGEMLDLDVEPAGGWFNTTYNLQRYYLDRDFELDGVAVTLAGNSVKLDSTTGATVSAMTYSLARATGLVTGTLTYLGVKKTNHYGVLLMNRDAGATALGPDVWTAGFFTHKVNSTWTESLPFDILDVQIDRDWNEASIPGAGEEE